MRYLITSLILILLSSILYASTVKELSLVCEKQEVLEDIERVKSQAKEGLVPRNCLLLTSNANIKVLTEIKKTQTVKILIIDFNIVGYILKEDIIYDEQDKKRFDFF